jgi:phosphopantothenoylcysteine decarboxylase/phosphopantothenate--cysteine ligase
MRAAVRAEVADADALIMAAAVADFRPADPAAHKLKKSSAPDVIHLERTTDILMEISDAKEKNGRPAVIIGFSAETDDLEKNAQKKLQAKRLDLIIANEVGRPETGFETDTNRVTIFSADGTSETLPLMDKYRIAEKIVERLTAILMKE